MRVSVAIVTLGHCAIGTGQILTVEMAIKESADDMYSLLFLPFLPK